MGIPERKEKEKGLESIFKAIMVRNFPNLGRETDIQIHEVQRIPNRLTLNRVHRAAIYLNCQKSKTKNFESSKRVTYHIQGTSSPPIRLWTDFSIATFQSGENEVIYSKY